MQIIMKSKLMTRILFIVLLSFYASQRVQAEDTPNVMWQTLTQQGYYELEEQSDSVIQYQKLYEVTDEFWEEFKSNTELQELIKKINTNFAADKRNVTGITARGKPEFNWQQVEVSQAYLDYISKIHAHDLKKWQTLHKLHSSLQELLTYSSDLFKINIDKLSEAEPKIREVITENPDDTLITVKIIYRLVEDQAHFDLSGLSLFLNTDQDPKIDSLKLAPPGKYCQKAAYTTIPKKYAQSVILVPGAVLEEFGVDIKATAHLVEKPKQLRRSVIAFARIMRAPFGARPIRFPRYDDRGHLVDPCIRGLFVQDHFLPSDKKYFLRYFWDEKTGD